jgi:hypothetical protein
MLPPVAFMVATTSTPLQAAPAPGSSFVQHNLVSDIPGLAFYTHPGLGNPWGVWFSSQSPFWVSDNGAGLATIYNVELSDQPAKGSWQTVTPGPPT